MKGLGKKKYSLMLANLMGRFAEMTATQPAFLQACSPRLKVVSKWGTGTDSIDRTACGRLGVQLRNTLNAFTLPVADSVLGYILAFARQQPWMDRAIKAGEWKKIPGRSLSECTLGVIGVGNIGKAVLRRASAFGMTLLGNDIVPIPTDFLREFKVDSVSLSELARRSDFISVNCDLNPTSKHLVNKSLLAQMKPTAILINTARGSIVNEKDLVDALQSKKIAGQGWTFLRMNPSHPIHLSSKWTMCCSRRIIPILAQPRGRTCTGTPSLIFSSV